MATHAACALVRAIFIAVFVALTCAKVNDNAPYTDRPVIGILTQPSESYGNYLAASYVKFMESAGARVVPILYNSTEDELHELFKKVNGIIFPGGAASVAPGSPLYKVATVLIDDVRSEMATHNRSIPLWGTCLGFELLHVFTARSNDCLSEMSAENMPLPLKFTPAASSSTLFGSTPSYIMQDLRSLNLTMNFHHYGVVPSSYEKYHDLAEMFNVLATSVDENGLEFVAAIEGKTMPIYGTQFHPEKNQFEWSPSQNTPHNATAVRVMEYFSGFLVEQARHTSHSFPSEEELNQELIYNYAPTFTDCKTCHFDQVYSFGP